MAIPLRRWACPYLDVGTPSYLSGGTCSCSPEPDSRESTPPCQTKPLLSTQSPATSYSQQDLSRQLLSEMPLIPHDHQSYQPLPLQDREQSPDSLHGDLDRSTMGSRHALHHGLEDAVIRSIHKTIWEYVHLYRAHMGPIFLDIERQRQAAFLNPAEPSDGLSLDAGRAMAWPLSSFPIKARPNSENVLARLLLAMLNQCNIKQIDWDKVACDSVLLEPISTGHAARMRFSRYRNSVAHAMKKQKPVGSRPPRSALDVNYGNYAKSVSEDSINLSPSPDATDNKHDVFYPQSCDSSPYHHNLEQSVLPLAQGVGAFGDVSTAMNDYRSVHDLAHLSQDWTDNFVDITSMH